MHDALDHHLQDEPDDDRADDDRDDLDGHLPQAEAFPPFRDAHISTLTNGRIATPKPREGSQSGSDRLLEPTHFATPHERRSPGLAPRVALLRREGALDAGEVLDDEAAQ